MPVGKGDGVNSVGVKFSPVSLISRYQDGSPSKSTISQKNRGL